MYIARHTKEKHNCMLLFEGMEGLTFIVFDTETTGLKKEKDFIVEIGAKKYQIQNHKAIPIEDLSVYIKPPFYMDDEVVAIHQISNEFLQDKPTEEELFPVIQEFFGRKPIVIGYNVGFDVGMMEAMYERNHATFETQVILDVREMGYDIFTDNSLPDHRLGTIVQSLGLDKGLQFHSAVDDAEATFRLLLYCYEEYKQMPAQGNFQRLYVNTIYFWKGHRKEQSGIYLKTNLGIIYFSTFKKQWCSSQVNLQTIDIDAMESYVLSRLRIPYEEFQKLTECKFARVKSSCREYGIFL